MNTFVSKLVAGFGEQDIVVVFFLLAKAIFSNFKTKQKGCVDA